MSLRMMHILIYKCEDGLLLRICDTHNERDDMLAAAQREWKDIGGKGDAPCDRVDALVPFHATPGEVKSAISTCLRVHYLKRQLIDALSGIVALDLIGDFIRDLLKDGPSEEPPHTTH